MVVGDLALSQELEFEHFANGKLLQMDQEDQLIELEEVNVGRNHQLLLHPNVVLALVNVEEESLFGGGDGLEENSVDFFVSRLQEENVIGVLLYLSPGLLPDFLPAVHNPSLGNEGGNEILVIQLLAKLVVLDQVLGNGLEDLLQTRLEIDFDHNVFDAHIVALKHEVTLEVLYVVVFMKAEGNDVERVA